MLYNLQWYIGTRLAFIVYNARSKNFYVHSQSSSLFTCKSDAPLIENDIPAKLVPSIFVTAIAMDGNVIDNDLSGMTNFNASWSTILIKLKGKNP